MSEGCAWYSKSLAADTRSGTIPPYSLLNPAFLPGPYLMNARLVSLAENPLSNPLLDAEALKRSAM